MKKILLLFLLFLLDRVSKEVVERTLTLNRPYPEKSFFSFHLSHNYGAALSIEIPRGILIFFSVLVLILFSIYVLKKRFFPYSFSLIFAGVLGNLYDRIVYGYVIDFISVSKFPVFNLADSFLSFGIFLAILNLLKK